MCSNLLSSKKVFGILVAVLLLPALLPMATPAVAQDEIAQVGFWGKGPGGGFACRASVVYMVSGAAIQTWDVSDAENHLLTSEVQYPWPIQELEFYGDLLVGLSDYAFLTLDLADPLHPVEGTITEFPYPAENHMLCIGDNAAFVLFEQGELYAFDLTDPSAPVLAGDDYLGGEMFCSLAYDNGKIYTHSDYYGSFYIIDVTDPYNMGSADEYMYGGILNMDGILVIDGTIHLFSYYDGWVIAELDGWELSVVSEVSEIAPHAHHYFENELIAYENGVFNTYQFPEPDSPVLVDTVDPELEEGEGLATIRFSGDVFVFETYDDVFTVFNDAAGTSTDFEFPDPIYNGGLHENLYVTVHPLAPRMSFYDISDPANIPDPVTLDLPGGASFLTVTDGFAIASDYDDGVYVVDLTSGAPFTVRDIIVTDDSHIVTGLHNGYLYLSTRNDEFLKVFDLSTPGSAQEVATVATTRDSDDMVFFYDYLFFLTWDSILSFDVSDPEDPLLVNTLQIPGHNFKELTVSDGVLYLATGDDGLDLVDIAPNGELTFRTNHDTGGILYGMKSMSDHLYGFAGNSGVSVFDVSDPWDIQTIFQQGMETAATDLDVWGSTFVVLNNRTGFTIFQDNEVTPVHMGTFAATRVQEGAQVAWRVFSEFDGTAFHVWRGESEWDRERLTDAPLSGTVDFSWLDPAPPANATNYWLEETHTNGTSAWYGPVDLKAMNLPQHAVLHEPWPNPFNPLVALRVELPRTTRLVVTVHDVRGRHVATLADEQREAGALVLNWNGCDDQGRSMPTGAYFARMQTEEESSVQKLMLVK